MCNGKLFFFSLLLFILLSVKSCKQEEPCTTLHLVICKTGSELKNGTLAEILINPTHVTKPTRNGFYNFAYFLLYSKDAMKKNPTNTQI